MFYDENLIETSIPIKTDLWCMSPKFKLKFNIAKSNDSIAYYNNIEYDFNDIFIKTFPILFSVAKFLIRSNHNRIFYI